MPIESGTFTYFYLPTGSIILDGIPIPLLCTLQYQVADKINQCWYIPDLTDRYEIMWMRRELINSGGRAPKSISVPSSQHMTRIMPIIIF